MTVTFVVWQATATPAWANKPAVRFQHMTHACASAYKSNVVALLASLPLHQQLLLCCMALRGRSRGAPVWPSTKYGPKRNWA